MDIHDWTNPEDSSALTPFDDGLPGAVDADPHAGTAVQPPTFGGYSGSYAGIDDAWYSSDGYVYDMGGNRIGTH